MIKILVDDRERAGGLAEALRRVLHREVRVARLALGDVQIGPSMRVERKAAADFVASLAGGRLESQLLAQLRAGGRVVLIIEGEFTPQTLGGMNADSVREAMLRMQFDLRVPLMRSRDVDDTARWVAALLRYEDSTLNSEVRDASSRGGITSTPGMFKRSSPSPSLPFQAPAPKKSHGPLPGHATRRRTGTPASVSLAELSRIPGVGPRKAEALIDHFGSLAAVREATAEDLSQAPGIGAMLAETIYRRFHR